MALITPFVYFLVVSCLSTVSSGLSNLKNESQLIKDLFKYYDPLITPNKNNSHDWSIQVGFLMQSLVDLNEKEQVLSISAGFHLIWREPLLSWRTDEYSSNVIYVKSDMVWLPDIMIKNTVDNFGRVGSDSLKVYINSTGHLLWYPGDFYKLYCKIHVRNYPFDSQSCKFVLRPWSCKDKIVNLKLSPYPFIYGSFEENGEWKLDGVKTDRVYMKYGFHYGVTYTLFLKRKALFYVVNMILPVVFLSLLSSLGFALPANSGEKMTLCISVLLAYAVFLTLVTDKLPENSDEICFFSAYLAAQVFLSAAATIASVGVLSLHHRAPGYLNVSPACTWFLPGINKVKVEDEVWAVKVLEKKKMEEESTSRIVLAADLATAADKLCLRVFTSVNVIITFVFFCLMVAAAR